MPTLAHKAYLDSLPEEWERVRLGDLGKVYAGSTPRRSEPKYWGGHIPWLTPSEVTGRTDKWVGKTDEYITDEGYDSTSVHLVPEGSLLVTTRATIGEVVIADVPITTNQGFKNLVLGSDNVPLFYYYVLRFVADEMERLASGSTFDEISKSDFVDIVVPRTSPSEQRRIADVLDTVDAAIQETDAVVEKQEQVKTGLLQDLLTQGLDAEGRLRDPEREPEAFRETELGDRPVEWEIRPVGELLTGITQGWSPKCHPDPAPQGQWGVLRTTSVQWEGFQEEENKALPSDLSPRPEYEVEPMDILMTRAGPASRVGVVVMVKNVRDKLLLSDKLYRLEHSSDILPGFLYAALSSEELQGLLGREKTGMAGSQTNISQRIVKELPLPYPPLAEQERIVSVLEGHANRIASENGYSEKLQCLKTGLMQDLLTGQVRVPEAEARVEEVVA